MASYQWSYDNDNCSRRCEISFMKHGIYGGLVDHWALYFDWGDRSATYEADNHGGYLIPTWNEGRPLDRHQGVGSWRTERVLTRTKICSPKSVNRKAKIVSRNGTKYWITVNNCHHWLIELAEDLDLELDVPIETYFEVLEPIVGLFEGSSSASSSKRGTQRDTKVRHSKKRSAYD